ncbi:uncharacterized protein TNCV_812011 [Trichonephila clavipes]|nr:uncharacterized protein TNCV_812011 [Trichonephila clavipes]
MDLETFLQNRVAKIQELYPNQLWRYEPSDQNPADLVSRGVDPDKLLQQKLWFNGPTFLSGDDYPNRFVNCREKLDEYNSELKNCVNEQIENFQSVLNIHVNDFLNDLLNLSNNYITILRVLSFIFRFVENLKGINKVAGPLTTKEFEKAETFLVKEVQEQEFSSDINHIKTSADWVAYLVCRWPSAPKIVDSTPAHVGGFLIEKINSDHEPPCRMIIRHVKKSLEMPVWLGCQNSILHRQNSGASL